jgi:hypothetical protein
VTPVGEGSRFDVVLEEKLPADALVGARSAALHDGMLTTPEDFSGEIVHVLLLRLEAVGRFEHAGSRLATARREEAGERQVDCECSQLRVLDDARSCTAYQVFL